MEHNDWFKDDHDEDNDALPMTNLMSLANGNLDAMMDQAMHMMEMMVDYKELRMMYTCAIKEIRTKFEVLNTEFNIRYQRNPIDHVSTRLKSNQSILSKMARKRIPFSLPNLEQYIQDIAGIRIICSYQDDIYELADALLKQDDILLLSRKDYIQNPKPNGYRSLHLIISLPVYFADQKKRIPVEVQIRTIAMDFWASLEHQMKYKQEIPNQQEVSRRLLACADQIAALDHEMLAIRQQIEAAQDKPTQEDILLHKLQHLDTPIY